MPSSTRWSSLLSYSPGEKFTLSAMDQETYCLCCTWPLLIGDGAYLGYDEEVYCSRRCCMELTT